MAGYSRTVLLALLLAHLIGAVGGSALGQTTAEPESPPAGSPTGAMIEYHQQDQTLTLHASAVPLRQLLDALSAQTRIRFKPPAPATEFDDRAVSCSFDRMPLERAIKQILGPSNTAMIYNSRRTSSGDDAQPVLAEVQVIDLGIVPIVATPDSQTARGPTAAPRSSVLPDPRLSPQTQSRLDALNERRAQQRVQPPSRQGGRPNENNARTRPGPRDSRPRVPAQQP